MGIFEENFLMTKRVRRILRIKSAFLKKTFYGRKGNFLRMKGGFLKFYIFKDERRIFKGWKEDFWNCKDFQRRRRRIFKGWKEKFWRKLFKDETWIFKELNADFWIIFGFLKNETRIFKEYNARFFLVHTWILKKLFLREKNRFLTSKWKILNNIFGITKSGFLEDET